MQRKVGAVYAATEERVESGKEQQQSLHHQHKSFMQYGKTYTRVLQVLPERLELGSPRDVAGSRHPGAIGTADFGCRREEQGPERTGNLKANKDKVGRPLDTASHADLAVVGQVDCAANDRARVTHCCPDTEVLAPVLDYLSVPFLA